MTSKRFEKFWADAFGPKLDWADIVNCTPHPITVMADLTEGCVCTDYINCNPDPIANPDCRIHGALHHNEPDIG